VDPCEFCAIVANEAPATTLYEDAETLAFFPLNPATLGHTLVIPKPHIPDLFALTPALTTPLMNTALHLAQAIRTALNPEGLNLITSAGAAASQTIYHLHLHLVPRWHQDSIGQIWPVNGQDFGELDKDNAAARIRRSLATSTG
jgi:histidine triad (HIT) family protein